MQQCNSITPSMTARCCYRVCVFASHRPTTPPLFLFPQHPWTVKTPRRLSRTAAAPDAAPEFTARRAPRAPSAAVSIWPYIAIGRTLLNASALVELGGHKSQVLPWTRSSPDSNVTILNQAYVSTRAAAY